MNRAAVITVGSEVLNGSTADTNSSWVCHYLASRGVQVDRVVIVPDEMNRVLVELRRSLELMPSLVITLGGLGPTDDDLTLQAVSLAVGSQLALSEQALAIVQTRYERLQAEGVVPPASSEHARMAREKMAWIPIGAIPLLNEVGAAPGVVTKAKETCILSLPGNPGEVRWILENSATAIMNDVLGSGVMINRVMRLDTNDESALAEPLKRTVKSLDDEAVYIKSRPYQSNERDEIVVTVVASGPDAKSAMNSLDDAQRTLEDSLEEFGIRVRSTSDETW